MTTRAILFALAVAVVPMACGVPPTVTDSQMKPEPEDTPPTLGMTPEEFIADWNSAVGAGMPSLVFTEFDSSGGHLERRLSEVLALEVVVDPVSGQLTHAEVRSSTDRPEEYDDWRMIAAWAGLIRASNPGLDDGGVELNHAFELIGLPTGRGNPPDGFGSGDYTSSGVIQGVEYVFEENPEEYVLTARPAS